MKKSSKTIRDVINVILSTGTKHAQVITTQLNRSLNKKNNDWRAIMQYMSTSAQLLNTDMRWKDAVIATIHNLKRRVGGDLYTTWTTHQIWKNPTRQFVYTYVIFVYCDEKAVSLRAVSRTAIPISNEVHTNLEVRRNVYCESHLSVASILISLLVQGSRLCRKYRCSCCYTRVAYNIPESLFHCLMFWVRIPTLLCVFIFGHPIFVRFC